MEELQQVPLYGGAISVLFPTRLRDVSDFRPVPDHQEVWADPTEDQSVIVEIVEHNNTISDQDCAMHYWEDQVTCNNCPSNAVHEVQTLSPTDLSNLPSDKVTYACVISGLQAASKGRQSDEAANQVSVMLTVLRIPCVGSDILITLNSPVVISASSQAAEHAGAGVKQRFQAAPELLKAILTSFTIHDWSLFG